VARTLDGLFLERVRRSGDRPAYRWHERASDQRREMTWSQAGREVGRWQAALAAEGLGPGDRVALQLRNCPEWVLLDQAALGLGLVVVPLYTDDRPENIAYILSDAGVKLVLVQDAGRWGRLAPLLHDVPGLERVLLLEDAPERRSPGDLDRRVRPVETWLPAEGVLRERNGDPGGLASVVYTSGTTGRPKGVMLSHRNLLYNAVVAPTGMTCYEEDVFLSFLPLSHALERTGGYYLPMAAGSCVAFARSIGQLAQDMLEVRPTLMIAVPRVFERMYAKLHERLGKESRLHRALFDWTVAVGWHRFEHSQGRAPWGSDLLLWPLLQRLVAVKVTARMGGRMRIAVSGGAALPPGVAKVFIALGLPLLQGYGLTETSPVVSVNRLDDNRPASVGRPLPGLEVSIGDDDELLVRGPIVMLGYWRREAETREVLDADGWLHTGDQARIDDRYIYITGRLKDVLVLSNGEKVPPADMEMAITLDPLFEQALVLGEGRPFLGAILVLDPDCWGDIARGLALDPDAPQSLCDRRVFREVQMRLRERLALFPGYAKVRRTLLLLEPWSVDNGLLTPTMKVKRSRVLERYAGEIDALYAALTTD